MFRVSAFKRLAPCDPTVETLSHQLIQQCSVSGTAKGKGKLKAAQALKRKKDASKKGAASGAGSKAGLAEKLKEMAKKVMDAPPQVRHLSPKERDREAEREKLGLTSKWRQRETEILKMQAKESVGFEKVFSSGLDLVALGVVNGDAIPKYELTVEDGRRLAKEYSRVLWRQHRERQRIKSTLLRLKKEAIEALPEHLKAAALVPDTTPFPSNLFIPTLTPPVEGYIEKIRGDAQRTSVKVKLR